MAIISKEEARKILEKALSFSTADECEANLNGDDGGNIRYARNNVSTSGVRSNIILRVASSYGKKQGMATVNEFDDASLERAVKRSEELAQLAPENPEHMPFLGPQEFEESITWKDSTANITPACASIITYSVRLSTCSSRIQ